MHSLALLSNTTINMNNDYQNIGMAMGHTWLIASKAIEAKFIESKLDLTLHQFEILNILSINDHLIQQDLADFMKKDKSAVLRIIDQMEQKDLLLRVNDPVDRRKKSLQLTHQGIQLLRAARKAEKELFEEIQKGLNKEDINTFYKVIQHMQQNLSK